MLDLTSNTKIHYSDLRYRVPLYHERVPFVVLWSEKAACTTVVKWFFSQVGILQKALRYHNWIHNFENEVFKASPDYLVKCAEAINNGKPVIKFVRDPFARLYSGFLETCSRRVLTDDVHWSTAVRRSVLTDLLGKESELEYSYSFMQFVNWLDRNNPGLLDPHLAPQFQNYERAIDITLVKLDGTNNAFQELERAYGLKDTQGRPAIYKSGHHHKKQQRPIETQIRSLSLGMPVLRNKDFQIYDVTPKALAMSKAAAIVRRHYRRDFEAYDYA